jgi:hypothetical protein
VALFLSTAQPQGAASRSRCYFFLFLSYIRLGKGVGAGAGAASICLPDPEQNQNDAAPLFFITLHRCKVRSIIFVKSLFIILISLKFVVQNS